MFAMSGRLFQGGNYVLRNKQPYGLPCRIVHPFIKGGPSQSVTNQKSLLNEFVQQHRLSVYDTYVDDGWSGTSFDRPDFQRMIEDIEAKKVNMVITKDDCVIIEPTQKDLENQGFVAGSICF